MNITDVMLRTRKCCDTICRIYESHVNDLLKRYIYDSFGNVRFRIFFVTIIKKINVNVYTIRKPIKLS